MGAKGRAKWPRSRFWFVISLILFFSLHEGSDHPSDQSGRESLPKKKKLKRKKKGSDNTPKPVRSVRLVFAECVLEKKSSTCVCVRF